MVLYILRTVCMAKSAFHLLFSIQLYVGKTDIMDKRSEVTWKFDFSDCGLVVRQFRVKGRSSEDDEIDWRVIGDERVGCRPMLAGGFKPR